MTLAARVVIAAVVGVAVLALAGVAVAYGTAALIKRTAGPYVSAPVLTDSCDPGAARSKAIAADPVARIYVDGAHVTRANLAAPENQWFESGCAEGRLEIEYTSADLDATYDRLKLEVARAGWTATSREIADPGGAVTGITRLMYFAKVIRGVGYELSLDRFVRHGSEPGSVGIFVTFPPA
jgi:hypothetical protein